MDPNALLREVMRQKRIEIAKTAYVGVVDKRDRARRRRFVQKVARASFKAKDKRPKFPKQLLAYKYKKSQILDTLVPDREKNWVPILQRRPEPGKAIISFESTSLIDHPAETLATMRRMVAAECYELGARLDFQDEYCTDIGAFLVLGEIWPAMVQVYTGGKMNLAVQKALKAVGLGHQLGIKFGGSPTADDIWAFPLQRRRPKNTTSSSTYLLEPQKREMVADGLCDAINEWLALPKIDQELTVDGRVWLTSLVGELLDNAERHGAPETKDGDWSTAAFVARRMESGEETYRCYMAFLSVGATISESLRTAGPKVQEHLATYVSHHRDCGISEETLRTLIALQDGITRDAAAEEGRRGGFGLQEVLHFVQELGGTLKDGCDPRVTIISGNACLQLRHPYIMGVAKGVDRPRVLWCNENNSPQDPPDRRFVYDLKDRFAGTIISIAFTLDPEYLNGTIESEQENGQTD